MHLGREGPFADACRVGLADEDHPVDFARGDARHADAADADGRGGDEGVGPEIHVEQDALRAFEEHLLAGAQTIVHAQRDIVRRRHERLADREQLFEHFARLEVLLTDALEELVLLRHDRFDALPQVVAVEQVAEAQALAGSRDPDRQARCRGPFVPILPLPRRRSKI